MSDDEDYMSDKFLDGRIENDVRPGLLKSHSEKRSFLALKRKRELDEINKRKNPSIRQVESEKRKEGLEKPIEETNKGFALMQKMGYKPGTSIGKNSTGRVEPIPIELRQSRKGLGGIEMDRKLIEQKRKEISSNAPSTSEYRSRMLEKSVQKLNEIDFRKSQKMCEYLDREHDVEDPVQTWYWLTANQDNDDRKSKKSRNNAKRRKPYYQHDYRESDDESDRSDDMEECSSDREEIDSHECDENNKESEIMTIDTSEKLGVLTEYLRSNYFYCIWCCVKYNNPSDINDNCPGKTRDDH